MVTSEDEEVTCNPKWVAKSLSPEKFKDEKTEDSDEIGLTNGLAWTMFGGVLLTSEVSLMPGSGKLIITGKLGDVMQESAQAAMTYVRSRAMNLGLAPDFYQKVDLHVHFPEGAAPKDGPSAGITMVTSIVSALTRIPVPRGGDDGRDRCAGASSPSEGSRKIWPPPRGRGRSSSLKRTRRTCATFRSRS